MVMSSVNSAMTAFSGSSQPVPPRQSAVQSSEEEVSLKSEEGGSLTKDPFGYHKLLVLRTRVNTLPLLSS